MTASLKTLRTYPLRDTQNTSFVRAGGRFFFAFTIGFAAAVSDTSFDESLSGVGKLGAQLTALLGYGRLECFPLADARLQAWVAHHVHESTKPDPRAVAEWAEQWGDVRGLVALYIYAELLKNGEL